MATVTYAENITVEVKKFNAGELSPLMNARSEFPKYRSGAKTLENMLVRAQGPITRRPGTKYIAAVKTAADPTRIIAFEYSTTDAYIIEMGDEYFRFYRDGGQILDGGSPYEIVSPYDKTDLFEVQFVQDAEVMRMVHPDYAPYKLTRTGHTAWTMTEIAFADGPFLDENDTLTTTITPSATTGSITLTASASIFDTDHVGALWQVSHQVESENVSGQFWQVGAAVDSNSASLSVFEDQRYTLTTSGYWQGTCLLQRSYDAGTTWKTVKPFTYAFNGNVLYPGIEEKDDATAIYRVRLEDQYVTSHMYDHGEGRFNYTLATDVFIRRGIVDVTAVASGTSATATVLTTLASTDATDLWAEGAWSTYRGFPRTIEHHEQRCLYGGSTSYPQTIWGSITASQDADYDDFSVRATTVEDDAWTYILPGMNPIQWMKSQELLMIGTTSAIGLLGQPDKPIDPTFTPIYRTQAKNGSAYIQAISAVDAVLFVERGGEKVREVLYTYASDRYVAPDMTILSEHVTGDGLDQIAFQNRPDPVLWAIREDGQLLSFTYQRKHDVLAWSRSDTGASGLFKSVAVIPGTNEDEVWTVAARTVNSNAVRYVEQHQPYDWGTDQNDCWYVDSGVTSISNLSHLEGETVALFADGRPIGSYTVSSGAISPSGSYTNHVVGLPYTSVYESMPLVAYVGGDSTGSLKARTRKVQVDVHESLGFHIGSDSSNLSDVEFSTDSFATTIDVYTGLKPSYNYMPFMHGWSREPIVYVSEADPVPLTVRGLSVQMEVVVE
jgi:hypothetical protein